MALLAQWGLLRVSEAFQFLQRANFYCSRLGSGRKYRLFTSKGIDTFAGFHGWTCGCCELGQSGQRKFARAVGFHLICKHILERSKNLGHALLAETGSLRNRPMQISL